MILALHCNKASFRSVTFDRGFNVIIAERTKEETSKQSRNGLGKSTLIELVHFCLGGDYKGPITAEALKGLTFTLDLEIQGKEVSVSRNTEHPSRVEIEGDTSNWPVQPTYNLDTGKTELSNKGWAQVLGVLMFGLSEKPAVKYWPTFRTLVSYFSRRGKDAYINPFEFIRRQKAWQTQVANVFLLGLEIQDAIDFQALKDRKDTLLQIKKLASGAGTAKEFLGTLGEYEAQKVRLDALARKEEQELLDFKVHPQYEDMSHRANALTEYIHRLTNENVVDRRLVELYQQTLVDERPPESHDVVAIYERAGVELPGLVKKRLSDVQDFHAQLVGNRKSFLASELQRLNAVVQSRMTEIETGTLERAEIMMLLRTHGALEEYNKLQQKHLKTRAELETIVNRIKNLRDLLQGESSLRIDREILAQRALRDLDERATSRDKAIELFNANSQALYEAPGNLVVDVDDNGFRFKVEIQRSSSEGVGNMKVFCYDLTLAQLWSQKDKHPGFLLHDSIIFDGVDERQRARALELAAQEAEHYGFQYICTINSDAVPYQEFSSGFDFQQHIRLALSDKDDESRLMGMRFEIGNESEAPQGEEGKEAEDVDN